jgi:hypothetical protein
VRAAFSSPVSVEWMAGAVVVLILALVIFRMIRSRKPDPKMQLLLALMKDFPREERAEDVAVERGEDAADVRQEHGPLGPGGFSHIA